MGDRLPLPAISVVLPTHNRPELLSEAVQSVQDQSLPDWELLVVDDGSDPPAGRGVEWLRDPRIRILRLDLPGGAAGARNAGIRAARSPRVAFLDDDDRWEHDFLEQLSAALDSTPGADVAYAALRIRRPDGTVLAPPMEDLTGNEDPLSVLVRGNFIATPAVMARRSALERVGGFDERLPRLQDWDLWLRLSTSSRFVAVPRPLTHAAATPGGISDSPDRMVRACALLSRHRPDELGLSRHQRADFFYALATFLMVAGARRPALPYFFRSLAQRPRPARRWLAAAAAVLAPGVYKAVTRRGASRLESADGERA